MAARYSALEARREDIGDFPKSLSPAPSFDSGTLYSSIDKHGVGSSKDQAPRPRTNLAYLISLPMALHLAVLAFYIALCVVRVTGVEQNIQVALASASHTQTLINLISHLIMLAFSTAIIALMQPIATRSPFGNLPQPLTAVSDKISSWSGLGSSLLNLYHNVVFPATLGNALFTALYFSTLSGLGISSSFLFNVPAVNETITRNMMTRVGSPSISGLVPPGCDILSNVSTLTFEWYRSGMGIGMLTSDNTSVYPGLSANRIYDTLLSPMAASSNSSAEVGYTDFHVKCGSVPKVSISATNIDSFDTTPYYVRYHDNANSSASKFDANYHALLSVNYTLGNAPMELSDGLSISITNASRAVSRLWRPSGGCISSCHAMFLSCCLQTSYYVYRIAILWQDSAETWFCITSTTRPGLSREVSPFSTRTT
ncbi:hypothetical protein PENSPDRAFT_289646 [Peniophora sp. CONT]|nr:hypothetical protein PENSPDRAFT_289646 [Peniophora sp. CONT]